MFLCILTDKPPPKENLMTQQQTLCAGCEKLFMPIRKGQFYCSRKCQQPTTRNASRGGRKMENSRMNAIHFTRATDLTHMVYSTAPNKRLGVMKDILAAIPQDASLRRVLSDPALLKEPLKANGRLNISKAASAYTKKFFGVSITAYMRQVKAGTVNERFVPTASIAPSPTCNEPEVHTKRDAGRFLAWLREARKLGPCFSLKRGNSKVA